MDIMPCIVLNIIIKCIKMMPETSPGNKYPISDVSIEVGMSMIIIFDTVGIFVIDSKAYVWKLEGGCVF